MWVNLFTPKRRLVASFQSRLYWHKGISFYGKSAIWLINAKFSSLLLFEQNLGFHFFFHSHPVLPSHSSSTLFILQYNLRSFEWQLQLPIKSVESSELSLKFLPSVRGKVWGVWRRTGGWGEGGELGRKGQTWKRKQWYRLAIDSHCYEVDVIKTCSANEGWETKVWKETESEGDIFHASGGTDFSENL